jgi:hypothetical protein
MKSAGYTAQAKEKENQELVAQVKLLTKTVQAMQKQQAQRDDKQQQPVGTRSNNYNGKREHEQEKGNNENKQKKGKGFKYCDTCEYNRTHWSNTCRWPKDGHNEECRAP